MDHLRMLKSYVPKVMVWDLFRKIYSIIQGEFSLKNLNYFIKCTFKNQIEIYLANDLPLIVNTMWHPWEQ